MELKPIVIGFLLVFWIAFVTVLSLIEVGNLGNLEVENFDKYVHFVFYFIMTILWFLFLKIFQINTGTKLTISFFLSVIYGIIIEVLQGAFTQNRQPEMLDVAANAGGSFSAVIVLFLFSGKVKFLK